MWNDGNDITKGDRFYFNTLSAVKPLTKSEERKLLIDYKRNNNLAARDRLIKCNLRYACKLASGYRGSGICYSDLISEANDGLIEAIERYDLSKDVKLISYAKWWITQRLSLTIENSNKMRTKELPTDNDINERDDVNEQCMFTNSSDYEDSFIEDMEDRNTEEDQIKFLESVMAVLDDREKDIVSMYYGRGYDKEYTLEEIGRKYGITKERTRQIMEMSFKKIRCEAVLVGSQYLGH